MSKGFSGLFKGTNGDVNGNGNNGQSEGVSQYNGAGSKSVGKVTSVSQIYNPHSMPESWTPNSVVQKILDGKLVTERYYGANGKPYLDIDYTNHGNPKMHPIVPHEHSISFLDGMLKREKVGRAINK